MNKSNLASLKRENLIPSGYFCHVSLQREMYIFEKFCHYEKLWAIFWHVLRGLHSLRGACLPLCKSSLTKQTKRGICKGLLLNTRKSGLSPGLRTCFFFTSSSFHVLVGCPWNGHRLCHCARNIVLSFMLLLLLLNYDMWLPFLLLFLCLNALKRNLLSLWICWCTVPLLLWIKIKRTV